MKTIKVVASVIQKNNTVLATQRGYGEFKDKWEFPGGKIEQGESDEAALVREIKEELNASITPIRFLQTIEWDYPNFHLEMKVYLCRLKEPRLEFLEAENAKWLKGSELDSVDWLPADRLLLPLLKEIIDTF